MRDLITYYVNKYDRWENWCMIFASATARSNKHQITLSDKDFDDIYKAIGRSWKKWWVWRVNGSPIEKNDIPKVRRFLDQRYWTYTAELLPRDWRWGKKTKRNLEKWWRAVISLVINSDFAKDVNADWIMDSIEWIKKVATLWHQICMIIDDWQYYLVDIFNRKKHNTYLIKESQFEPLKKVIDKDFFIYM